MKNLEAVLSQETIGFGSQFGNAKTESAQGERTSKAVDTKP